MTAPKEKISTYAEFWPYYLQEHAKPLTRYVHYLGTAISLLLLAATFTAGGTWWYLLAAVFAGYFFAWIGHFFIEHNRPATFTYPVWSLVSDFRMFFHWITFTLPPELKKAGVAP